LYQTRQLADGKGVHLAVDRDRRPDAGTNLGLRESIRGSSPASVGLLVASSC
jgi:hypothetical protein